MATVYSELRKYLNKRGESAIRIVVVVDGKVSRTPTKYYVEPKYWDSKKLRIKSGHPQSVEYNHAIDVKINEIKTRYAQMDAAGRRVTSKKISQAAQVGDAFKDLSKHFSNTFRRAGKIGTADRHDSIATQVNDIFPGIKGVEMDKDWASEYREKLKELKQTHNTIVGKLNNIRAILNKAVEAGFIPANNLDGVVIGSFRAGKKEGLTVKEIDKLWHYRTSSKWMGIARRTYLFSYYATGARFKDVLLMPKSALYIEDGVLRMKWQTNKSKGSDNPKWMDIIVCSRLAKIIEQSENDSSTIFGLVDPALPPEELEKRIDNVQQCITKDLKNLIAKCGITKYITFHTARVSLIRHMDDISNRDLSTTKDIAGHSKRETTEGYIGINQKAIDQLTVRLYGN